MDEKYDDVISFDEKYIEPYVKEDILEESRYSEMQVIRVFRYLLPSFAVFAITYFFLQLFMENKVYILWVILVLYVLLVLVYHSIIYGFLKKGTNSYTIRFVNVSLEITTISVVFFIINSIFSTTVLFTGPTILFYMIMIIMSGFRYSLRLSLYAGIMAAFQHFLLYILLIWNVPSDVYARLIDLGPGGIIQKSLYLLICGAVSGFLAINTKSLIKKVSVRSYETTQIKNTFGQYVSEEVRDYILSNKLDVNAIEKNGVILFSDLRNFNDAIEKIPPREIINQLNEFFTEMVDIIAVNNGIVNKFIGDAIMAVFGIFDSDNTKKTEFMAVKTAVMMQDRLDELNKKWKSQGYMTFEMGIGIASGCFLTGNIGSENRKEFTCLGDVVNTASRLESLTKHFKKKIIASESVKEMISSDYTDLFGFLGEIDLKGKSNKVKVYEIDIDKFKTLSDDVFMSQDFLHSNKNEGLVDISDEIN